MKVITNILKGRIMSIMVLNMHNTKANVSPEFISLSLYEKACNDIKQLIIISR